MSPFSIIIVGGTATIGGILGWMLATSLSEGGFLWPFFGVVLGAVVGAIIFGKIFGPG